MKASAPIVPSLGLNAVRLSLLSGAVTAALGAPAMAQESMEIELDPFEHTVFVPGEDTRDVLVTGVKTATITAGFNNVLIAPRVEQETTFRLQGFGVSNALTGVSLVLPAGKGPVNVLASGGTTTIVIDTSNLPEDDGQDGGSGNENPDEDLGDLGGFRLLSDENQADYSDGQFKAGAKLVHAFANGGRAALETVGRNPQDVLVIAGHLHVTPDVQMSFGVEGSEETNANFHLGPSAGVVINKSWFMGLAEDKGAITFGKGTKAVFEKGAVFIITDGMDDLREPEEFEADDEAQEVPVEERLVFKAVAGSEVTGVEHLEGFLTKDGQVCSMKFEQTEDGWRVVEREWRYEGPLEEVVNALGVEAMKVDAPKALRKEFLRRQSPSEFGKTINWMTELMVGAGTSTEMIRTAENVVELTSRAAVAFEDDQAVRVSARTGSSRGRFKSVDGSTGGFAEWSRDVTGLDLEVHLRHLTRFGGLVVSYADADVGSSFDVFDVSQESNIASLAVYYGESSDRFAVTGYGMFSGANDKVRVISTGDMLTTGDPSRRAMTAGVAGSFYPDWGGYKDVNFTGAVSLTNYLKSTYGIAFDGERVMDVEEESRWVGTLQLQAGWHRLFRPASSSWIKADVTLGGRVRAGDLEVRQTVSAGGASSSVGHDDLTRGEIFGDAALKVRLRDSVAGLHVGGSTGPDGSRSWTDGVSFDYQF